MVVGQNGATGNVVPYLVEVETKLEFENAIALRPDPKANIVLLIHQQNQQTQKSRYVKKIPVQVRQIQDKID